MKKKAFTLYDVFVTILSMITYVIDVGSDILLIVTFLLDGHQIWAALSMAFVALSTFLMQIFSFSWHATDKTLTWKTFVVHALFLAPAHRYFQTIRLGIRAKQTKSRQDLDAVFRVNNDICLLRLIECFVESAPQLILQLYIILRYQQFNWVLGLSTVLSLTSMAWSMTAYTDGLRLAYKDKYNRKWLSMLAHTTWQTAMISARVMAIVIFSTVYQAWIFLAMGIHWCIMTFWITLQNADFGETSCEKRLFNSVSGFIYIFCFLNLKDSRARWRILAYHAVMLGENSLLVLLWFQGRPDTVPMWMEISTISIVFGGYVVGGVFMMIYYGCCHPSGPKPEQDKEEMAYWFRRFSPREKRPKEKIFEIPKVPPHVADWLNASLNLSLASKADRLDVSHDQSRLGQQDYSRSLGISMDNHGYDNSPVVSYQRYREPSTTSTIMESDGEYTPRESTKLSYISASSSRHLIDSSSNLSVDSTDRYRSFNRDRMSSSATTDHQYNSSGLETPNKLFTISAINNVSGSYLTPKHTSHDSFYSSPEFKTKELSPLDAKKLWEESQGRIDQSVAQTITIVTHTDLDKRRSHSTITWRKNSDSSQNSLHGEYNETGVNRSDYKQTQSREADSHLGLTTRSQYNDMNSLQTPIKHCSDSMEKQDRFKILNSSYNQEVSVGQSDQTDGVYSKFVRGEEELYYQYNMSGTPRVAEQPTMFSPWSPSVEDNIPYIDESVVDEPIHGQDTAQVSTNNKEESVLSDWFADISSLHHTQPDRFWISGVNDTSDGRDRSNYDLSTTADESSQMSANRDYTDSSVEPRSMSSYQDSSHQLSGPLDSSVSLYQYNDSHQEEFNEKSYTDNLRTKSSHMMSGYCGSKVNISDVSDGCTSSRSLGSGADKGLQSSGVDRGLQSSGVDRGLQSSGVDRGLQSSGVDRGLQSSNNSYTDTSYIDSMNGSSQKDYRPNAISPILSKSATALEDSGYHRSKSTASSLSGGEFTENESVNRPNSEVNYYTESPSSRDYSIGSRSAGDYSVGSRSAGDNSMVSRSAGDYSVESRSAADYSVGSRSAAEYSVGSRSTADYSVGSRSAGDNSMGSRSAGGHSDRSMSAGDYSMGSRSAGDYSVGSRSAGGYSVGSQSTGDYSMGSRSPEDYSMGSRSAGDCSVGSQSVGGYRYDPRLANFNMNRSRPFDESLESKSSHDYTTDSRSNTDFSKSVSDMSREEDIFTRTKSLSKMDVTDNGSILGSSYLPGMDVTNEEYARQQSLHNDQIVPNSADKSKISTNSTNMDYSRTSENKFTGNRRKSSTRPDSRSSRKRSSLFDASVDSENNSLSVTKVSPVSVHNMKKSPHRLGRNIDLFNVSSWRNSMDIDANEGFTGIKSLMHVPPVKVINKPLPITNLTESPYKFRPRKPNLALTQLIESPYKFRSKPDEDIRRMRIPSDKENELYMHRNSVVSQRARRSLPTKPLYLVNAQNDYNDNKTRRKSDFQTPCYMYSSEGETEDMSGYSPSGNLAKDTNRQVLGALENTPGFSPIIVPEELHRVKSTDVVTKVVKPVVSTPLSAHNLKGSFQQLATPENYCSTVEV